jgi:hypothetical protein
LLRFNQCFAMLESQVLWLSAAEFAAADRAGPKATRRRVWGGMARREVGHIIEQPLRWWPWRVRAWVGAFEMPDDSAVFSGRRAGWLPGDWDVFDADGRVVGMIRGPYLFTADGTLVGTHAAGQERHAGRIIDSDANAISRWQPEQGGSRIEFAEALSEQPFIKMTIVIAALIGL